MMEWYVTKVLSNILHILYSFFTITSNPIKNKTIAPLMHHHHQQQQQQQPKKRTEKDNSWKNIRC